MRKPALLNEDEVLDIVARFLTTKGFRILALGANNAGLFRFRTELGGQKAPDLVVFLDPILLVCEGKIRSSELFRKSPLRGSDYDCMIGLSRSPNEQHRLQDEARRVLQGLGLTPPELISVKVGLVAATPFPDRFLLGPRDEVLFLELDLVTTSVTVHRDFESAIPL